MNSKIQLIADTVERLFKIFPKLPAKWRKKLAENTWWIVAIVATILVFTTISIAFALFSVVTMMGAAAGTYGYYAPAGLSPHWIMLQTLVLVEMIVVTGLLLMSIKGLRSRSCGGWNLLFSSFLVDIVIIIVNAFTYGLGSIIWSVLGLILGLYLIFEIKFYFRPKRKRK